MAGVPAGLPAGIRLSDHLSLGVIARTFPPERVRQILAETGKASERERDLPAPVMVYYVMALALYMTASTREVLRCLLEGLRWLWGAEAVKVAGKSGISQARTRLGDEPLCLLYERLVHPVATPATHGAWYRWWRLISLDGSCLDVADTAANRGAFGRPEANRGASAFPQLRFVALVENGTHVLFAARLDATDDPLHGGQEGRFFHGYYGCYCYLPLYVFCGDHLLAAKLRRSSIDASAGAVEETARLVAQIRARWPETRIVLRADSGFARDALMTLRSLCDRLLWRRSRKSGWCEANKVDYVLGLARNPRLVGEITAELAAARTEAEQSGKAARCFKEFRYRTLDSWSRERRVVAKAEQLVGGGETSANPRFVVTSLTADAWAARPLYEQLYCARGEMENRIKECQLDLFADRTSAGTMRANQLRLWFASMAYVLIEALRRIALPATRLAQATAGTIRLKLLKIGALVRVSVRRVTVAMASGHPWQQDWAIAHQALTAAAG